MTMSRRDIFAAGALVAALGAGATSACSPASIPFDLPNKFFVAIAKGALVEARKSAHPSISLALVSTMGTQMFEGPEDVTEALHRLMTVEGFSMIGDSPLAEDVSGGMYWRGIGPWRCSDMLKGDAIQLDTCGGGSHESVFNVFVNIDGASDSVHTILLLENRNLIVQLGDWSDNRSFGK